jgi:Flp pilus assembly pilin Flp
VIRDRGAAAAEYALVTAGICVLVVAGIALKGDDVADAIGRGFDDVSSSVQDPASP